MSSGRRSYFQTDTVTDDYLALDVRRLQRDELLEPFHGFILKWSRRCEVIASIQVRTEPNRIFQSYRNRADNGFGKDFRYPIPLNCTACHLGTQRPWFLCPSPGCGGHVAILYGGEIYECHRLSYPSQREDKNDRGAQQANRIRARLSWEPDILNPKGFKPKGMHWRTFERLNASYDALVEQSLTGISQQFRTRCF